MIQKKCVPIYMVGLSSSRIEKYLRLFLYILLVVIALTLPMLWCWPLIVVLSVSVFFTLKKAQKYTCLTTQQDGSILLEDAKGEMLCARIRGESRVYPFLVVLHVCHAYKECILLWPDSADASALRHLRVWLYWHWSMLDHSAKQH